MPFSHLINQPCRYHKDHRHPHHHHGVLAHGALANSLSETRTRNVKVVRRVLDVNDTVAAENRERFHSRGIFVLNLMSSPGSGKTTTLEKTLARIAQDINSAVIVGDICTTHDADRLAVTGVPVVQVNTDEFGGDCHLAAHVVAKALDAMDLDGLDLLIVENVGNLVCPAEFDIGEDTRVVILSVTEGEDKPSKYPLMFRKCEAALLNKIDLLPYLDYDKSLALEHIHNVHPEMPVFELSAKTGEGFKAWLSWLKDKIDDKKGHHSSS